MNFLFATILYYPLNYCKVQLSTNYLKRNDTKNIFLSIGLAWRGYHFTYHTEFEFEIWCLTPLSAIFQLHLYIMVTSFSGGGSRSIQREPVTLCKQLVNFITCGCESSAPFFAIDKAGRHAIREITSIKRKYKFRIKSGMCKGSTQFNLTFLEIWQSNIVMKGKAKKYMPKMMELKAS